ncbi:MAG: hypothetical protein N2588_03745 [Rhodovarius sp.]|nr:hypothetical protein [Rhodovarius sp.]
MSRQIARPEAIRACIAALAAEAFEAGHIRAARLLAHTAALLALPQLWDGAGRP